MLVDEEVAVRNAIHIESDPSSLAIRPGLDGADAAAMVEDWLDTAGALAAVMSAGRCPKRG
jgi:hypothetical protein